MLDFWLIKKHRRFIACPTVSATLTEDGGEMEGEGRAKTKL